MTHPDVLFVSHQDALELLSVEQAMRICEDVYRMLARGSVVLSKPPSFKLDIAEEFNNHWHVKGVLLKDVPVTGVRLYNYYDDGKRNTVGALDCTRYIVLSDPRTGHALAIVDEHLTYGLRSAAAAVIPCKWVGPVAPKVLGLVGIGSMGTNTMRCLLTLYRFEEIRVTSRRPETRASLRRAVVEDARHPGARAGTDRGRGARRRHRGRRHDLVGDHDAGGLAQAGRGVHFARAARVRAGWMVEGR